jgi:hypothetical protein
MLHRIRVPALPGLIAVVLGIALAIFGSSMGGPTSNWIGMGLSLFALYFLAGSIMGWLWPRPSLVWGLWLVLPLVLLILLSVSFGGHLGAFLRHDLAPILGAVGGGLAGAAMGAMVRARFSEREGATGA